MFLSVRGHPGTWGGGASLYSPEGRLFPGTGHEVLWGAGIWKLTCWLCRDLDGRSGDMAVRPFARAGGNTSHWARERGAKGGGPGPGLLRGWLHLCPGAQVPPHQSPGVPHTSPRSGIGSLAAQEQPLGSSSGGRGWGREGGGPGAGAERPLPTPALTSGSDWSPKARAGSLVASAFHAASVRSRPRPLC